MRLADIRSMIESSRSDDWHKVECWGAGSGPSYKNSFISWKTSESVQTAVDAHPYLAVYREDVNLSIAWGLDRESYWADPSELTFDFQENFPDSKVSVFFLDVFWNGNLVDREHVMSVDGGRAYLPLTQVRRKQEGGMGPDAYEEYLPEEDMAIVRLVHDLVHTADFDEYVTRSGVPLG